MDYNKKLEELKKDIEDLIRQQERLNELLTAIENKIEWMEGFTNGR